MGMLDKLKSMVGIEDIDEDDIDEEEVLGKSIIPDREPEVRTSIAAPAPMAAPAPIQRSQAPAPKSPNTAKYTAQLKMVVIEPESFEESPKLVDSLKAKKPVIINLENLETDVARKIFDFLSGATYALNGNVQKVANNIFVFAPENVDVSYNENKKASQNASEAPKSPWAR